MTRDTRIRHMDIHRWNRFTDVLPPLLVLSTSHPSQSHLVESMMIGVVAWMPSKDGLVDQNLARVNGRLTNRYIIRNRRICRRKGQPVRNLRLERAWGIVITRRLVMPTRVFRREMIAAFVLRLNWRRNMPRAVIVDVHQWQLSTTPRKSQIW